MRTINRFFWLRNITTLALMVAVFAATSLIASAAPENSVAMGELTVTGSSVDGEQPSVILNGEKAISGRTFFSSGTISTTESASATINLGKLGSVTIAPNSVLSLNFGNNAINGTITAGQVKVLNAKGVIVNIRNAQGLAANNVSEGVFDANASAPRQDDGTVSDGSQLALVLVFAGIVGAATVYLLTRDEGPNVGTNVSPVR
jgi:hypothetical protein